MDLKAMIQTLREGKQLDFPSADADTLEYARSLDAQDELAPFRSKFNIPTKRSLQKSSLDADKSDPSDTPEDDKSIYFVGNSLGAQPKTIRAHLDAYLETWSSIGVNGHFTTLRNSPLTSWQDMAEDCARLSAHLVGAQPSEIAIMNTLTVNLHLLMASFYRPTEERYKIIIETRPFPSDWYAVQSQIAMHNLPTSSLIEISPDPTTNLLSTSTILSTIDAHASTTALLLLPGIQYYTGQLLDMKLITAHARARGITVGWDLAHAVGNVPLSLHDWDVDFAVWCNYKYVNAGPGAIAGAFVHARHGGVGADGTPEVGRLAGWYGVDKKFRFAMGREFRSIEGAGGWQVSNPSAVDLAGLKAALGVFAEVEGGMEALRGKAMVVTRFLEWLLLRVKDEVGGFRIITPPDVRERGSQLSLFILGDRLDRVSRILEERGVVCDVRKPSVIRVAPVPLYCRFEDVWRFVQIFKEALTA
ncbi:putative kynureninase [Echria macrotheca]|uniref:Kynureninase n=1 Tax=Echria macrotheca TaxID=438768 RepID=A0AAJ0F7N3_9PEZI|nr:putative kynureninase [Echria macrotheca]